MSVASVTNETHKSGKRNDAKRVLGALEYLCDSSKPGSRIPRHTDLMSQLNASERSVLRALGELQRSGRIIRRPRAGTFVADPNQTREKSLVLANLADSRTIIVLAKLDYSFFSLCLDRLSHKAERNDLSILCQILGAETKPHVVPAAELGSPLGYLLFHFDLAPLAKSLLSQGHRVVVIGSPGTNAAQDLTYIHGDHEQGAYLATQHLLELGHRHIAFAMVAENARHCVRWLGQETALRDAHGAGIDAIGSILTQATVDTWRQNPSAARAYFRQPDAPTGLVVWNDHKAVELLTILLHAGIQVPAEVSLVGYDNLPEGTHVAPQLTTIDQGIDQQLRLALRLLTQSEQPLTSKTVFVTPTLVVRESTGPPKHLSLMEELK